MKNAFPALILMLPIVGFVLGASYLWMKIQVWRAGEGPSSFSLDHDTLLFSKYREIAKARYLPLWPLYLYWASLVGVLILGMGLVAVIHN